MYKVESGQIWYNGAAKEGKHCDVNLTATNAYWPAPIIAEKKVDEKTVDGVKLLLMQTGQDDAAWYSWVDADNVEKWEAPKDELTVEVEPEVVVVDEPKLD